MFKPLAWAGYEDRGEGLGKGHRELCGTAFESGLYSSSFSRVAAVSPSGNGDCNSASLGCRETEGVRSSDDGMALCR